MGEGVRLFAGTQKGLFVWRETRAGGWEEVFSGFTDRVSDAIAGSRRRPEIVFTTVGQDGLYRTIDGGRHWTRVLAGEFRAVTVDPTDDRVVYAGAEPVQLWRSEDGGDHWTELTGLQALPEAARKKWWTPYPPHTGHVRHVFVHPDDPRILYLCLEHGGVVRSFDRGETWEDVSGGIDYVDMHVLANLPGSKERYYVSSARGFFTSDDPARGWVRAEHGMTRNYFHDHLFLPPARPGALPQLLVAAADGSPGFWRREVRGARATLFRSDDGAASWYRVGRDLPEELDVMVWALTPHPHDPNAVFAGLGAVNRGEAVDTPSNGSVALEGGPGEVLLSRDRGDTWQRLDLRLPADRVLWAAPA
jgi:photosystem II stability/assembly factor-like uncharacterized protein